MRRKALKQKKIWNPALFGIRNPLSWGIRNPQGGIQNPRLSWIPLHGAKTWVKPKIHNCLVVCLARVDVCYAARKQGKKNGKKTTTTTIGLINKTTTSHVNHALFDISLSILLREMYLQWIKKRVRKV